MNRLKLINLILIGVFTMGFVSLSQASEAPAAPVSDETALKIFKLDEAGNDIRIPTKIWTEILGDGKSNSDEVSFTTIRVRFKEKNPGVLIEPEFMIELPRGGGEIDLARFVGDRPGTFKIFFDIESLSLAKKAHVFYVSKARKRKLDGEVWGAGCKKYLDLTNFILGKGAKDGIEVNTTRSRHLSVLMGHFIFAADKKMTQITFKDSAQSSFYCEGSGDK